MHLEVNAEYRSKNKNVHVEKNTIEPDLFQYAMCNEIHKVEILVTSIVDMFFS